jgi:hypothetical protein
VLGVSLLATGSTSLLGLSGIIDVMRSYSMEKQFWCNLNFVSRLFQFEHQDAYRNKLIAACHKTGGRAWVEHHVGDTFRGRDDGLEDGSDRNQPRKGAERLMEHSAASFHSHDLVGEAISNHY